MLTSALPLVHATLELTLLKRPSMMACHISSDLEGQDVVFKSRLNG